MVTTTSTVNDFINRFKTAPLHVEEAKDSPEEGPGVVTFEYGRVTPQQVVVARARANGLSLGIVWFCALLMRGGWDKVASYRVVWWYAEDLFVLGYVI